MFTFIIFQYVTQTLTSEENNRVFVMKYLKSYALFPLHSLLTSLSYLHLSRLSILILVYLYTSHYASISLSLIIPHLSSLTSLHFSHYSRVSSSFHPHFPSSFQVSKLGQTSFRDHKNQVLSMIY